MKRTCKHKKLNISFADIDDLYCVMPQANKPIWQKHDAYKMAIRVNNAGYTWCYTQIRQVFFLDYNILFVHLKSCGI